MKQLLETDFLASHKVSSKAIADALLTRQENFDLDDPAHTFGPTEPGAGLASFHNEKGELEIIHYEGFIDQCKRPSSFLNKRSKCDYLLAHTDKRGTALLLEITSATGTKEGLAKPIPDRKHGNITYRGGKYEKCEEQLYQSLRDLKHSESIADKLNAYARRICLMAYRVIPNTDNIRRPFARYLKIEAASTSDEGAIVPCPKIEALGFEYRRIDHQYVFDL